MLGSFWNFIRRHRKKFIFLGATAGAGYLTYHWLQAKVAELRNSGAQEALQIAQRRQHFENNQRTCSITLLSLLPSLREALEDLANTDRIMEEMRKARPEEKLKLWEEMKIVSITRSLVTCYALSLLSVTLRMQMNVLGGYMYCDLLSASEGSGEQLATAEVQKIYLDHIHIFLQRDLSNLYDDVKLAVFDVVSSLSLKEKFSRSSTEQLVNQLHQKFHGVNGSTAYVPASRLLQYIHFDESEVPGLCVPRVIKQIMHESDELLRSADFTKVLELSTDLVFDSLLDHIAKRYKQELNVEQPRNGFQPADFHSLEIPLAKLLATFNSFHKAVCVPAPNPQVQRMILLEDMNKYAANVYEAFSQPGSLTS